MRILHLDAGREMRGGQWQVLRLIEGLAGAGVESTLLARAGSPLEGAARDARLARRAARFRAGRAAGAAARSDPRPRCTLPHARRHRGRRAAGGGAAGRFPGGLAMEVRARAALPGGFRIRQTGSDGRRRSRGKDQRGLRWRSRAGAIRRNRVLALANFGDPQKGAPLAMEAARLAGVELLLTDNLERDLPQAAAFVYITHAEGLGSAALLAMSAGVPVIASRVGGLPEVVRDRETGLLVENTPAAVAAAILELARDPEFARRLGQAARRAVVENFTVDHMVRRTMEVYQKVLS
jgi:hypothetical protein